MLKEEMLMSLADKSKKIWKFLRDSDYRFLVSAGRGWKAHVPPEEFLKRMYRICMGRELNLENPVSYTEKLQWLKLYDHRPEYTTMVDKYAAKQYVADKIGEQYVIPLLGVWDRVEDIDFDALPDRFVLQKLEALRQLRIELQHAGIFLGFDILSDSHADQSAHRHRQHRQHQP